jgi:hypothetical protein
MNPDRIVSIRVPPFVKPPSGDEGGQGGFFHAPVWQLLSNPPQPPFTKGGRTVRVQS